MGFTVLAFAALAVVSVSGAPGGRIVGGEDATEGEFPYQVSMKFLATHSCGASIIGREWVVTAGHCSGSLPSLYSFRVGSINRIFGGTSHKVVEKHVHPGYGTNPYGAPVNDIALFKVTPPFQFDANTAPIALPAFGQETPAGSTAVISGWGSMREGSVFLPFTLQKASVPIVDKSACESYYAAGGGVPENEICAGIPQGGKDACQGDSGGPLAVNGYLHGIVSWGNGCGRESYPGVYTEVSHFRDWISQVTGI